MIILDRFMGLGAYADKAKDKRLASAVLNYFSYSRPEPNTHFKIKFLELLHGREPGEYKTLFGQTPPMDLVKYEPDAVEMLMMMLGKTILKDQWKNSKFKDDVDDFVTSGKAIHPKYNVDLTLDGSGIDSTIELAIHVRDLAHLLFAPGMPEFKTDDKLVDYVLSGVSEYAGPTGDYDPVEAVEEFVKLTTSPNNRRKQIQPGYNILHDYFEKKGA